MLLSAVPFAIPKPQQSNSGSVTKFNPARRNMPQAVVSSWDYEAYLAVTGIDDLPTDVVCECFAG